MTNPSSSVCIARLRFTEVPLERRILSRNEDYLPSVCEEVATEWSHDPMRTPSGFHLGQMANIALDGFAAIFDAQNIRVSPLFRMNANEKLITIKEADYNQDGRPDVFMRLERGGGKSDADEVHFFQSDGRAVEIAVWDQFDSTAYVGSLDKFDDTEWQEARTQIIDLTKNGNVITALSLLGSMTKRFKHLSDFYIVASYVQLGAGSYPEADLMLRHALRLCQNSEEAKNIVRLQGVSLLHQQRFLELKEHVARFATIFSREPAFSGALAIMLADEGDTETALSVVEKALSDAPNHPQLNRIAAEIKEGQGKTCAASTHYELAGESFWSMWNGMKCYLGGE